MYVTAQAVQLGDDDRTLAPLGLVQRGGELRPTRQRVVIGVAVQHGLTAADVCFAPGATKIMRRREMTRGAMS
jgi:hypothetical protein